MEESYKEIMEAPEHLYVVGDVHGCLDELKVLIDHICNKQKFSNRDILVFVGDYVDRGPDSKGVIDFLLEFQKNNTRVFFLKGNHEDMFLNYLGFEGHLGEGFLQNGGTSTLVSYGLSSSASGEEVLKGVPEAHLEFLENLDRYILIDDFIIAHAGLNPLRDVEAQIDEDLFWIRDEFISNIHFFDKLVVFGHTPHMDVLFHWPYKIGIDTGLVYGHKLTCIELMGNKLIQVQQGKKKAKVSSYKRGH